VAIPTYVYDDDWVAIPTYVYDDDWVAIPTYVYDDDWVAIPTYVRGAVKVKPDSRNNFTLVILRAKIIFTISRYGLHHC